MKKQIVMLFAGAAMFSSCSEDAIAEKLVDGLLDDTTEASALIGEWELTDYNYDAAAGGTNVNLGEDILNHLNAKDCVIMTFDFKDASSVDINSSVNNLQINATATGLDVPCPNEMDTSSLDYSYVDGVLSYEDINAEVVIDGDKLTIDAEQLNLPNFNASGELIFTKK